MVATREWATVDGVTAVALAAAGQVEIWSPRVVPGVSDVVGDRPVLAVTAVAATLPLAVRRRYPLAVLLVVVGALALQQVLTTPTEGLVLLLAGMIAAYSSSAFSSLRGAAVGGVVIVSGAALMGEDASDWAFVVIVLGGAWLVGLVVMQRSTDLSQAREDNRALSVRLAVAVDQLTKAHSLAASGRAPEELAALTPRELEVVRAIATGMNNAEIAAALFISEWTVKSHVASVLRKLSLRDRAQVVVAAYEAGLVRPRASAD
ncbi:MAG: Two-component system, response regulator [Mycobacterium sp.]|nr:Two-component system, response regulator [Mycobacterium sp.]